MRWRNPDRPPASTLQAGVAVGVRAEDEAGHGVILVHREGPQGVPGVGGELRGEDRLALLGRGGPYRASRGAGGGGPR